MFFEELDDITRRYMLEEFEEEELQGNPYRAKRLSAIGSTEFPGLMRQAIRSGNEVTLIRSLLSSQYWYPTEPYNRSGMTHQRKVNTPQAAELLGLTEFNTWYVRGLAKRLMEEGITQCQVYRASEPKWERGECTEHEGKIFPIIEIYNGHRAKYWPEPGNPYAISIPLGPNCHHTIRRIG